MWFFKVCKFFCVNAHINDEYTVQQEWRVITAFAFDRQSSVLPHRILMISENLRVNITV